MVFVIQHAQNKDSVALQLKLNELIAATATASNRLVDVEDLSAEELETLKKFYVKLSALAKLEQDIHSTHSIDEAESKHLSKNQEQKWMDIELWLRWIKIHQNKNPVLIIFPYLRIVNLSQTTDCKWTIFSATP